MLTLSSLEPLMAESLPIPPVSLSGRVPPGNSIVHLDTSAAPTQLTLWPDFHNGTAAALRVGPASVMAAASASSSGAANGSAGGKVTRNWIIYNRTAAQAKAGGETTHAGKLCFILLWST
jgi:anaphase-promoting complex subunit 1